jgi:tripartite-type tricarboxylate transporter receptor subunit TctC
MKHLNIGRHLFKLCISAMMAISVSAFAQYPDKTITMVVPFPPAGSTDVLGRILSQTMTKNLGQSVVVENTGGAGGTIGAGRVARANNDGYTLLFHNMAHSSAQALYAKLPYDPQTDFEPVGFVTEVPMILVARKNLPAENLQQLIAYIKANPGKVNFATAGVGATSHLCEVLFKSATGGKWTTVPYKGTGPALNDLLGEQVDLICDQPASTINHIKAGTLKPIGVATKERLSALPQVPTFAEQGMPKFQLAVWHGLYAPKGTPKPVVEKIAASLREALKDPVLVQKFQEMSSSIASPEMAKPEYLKTFLKSEVEKWKKALRLAGVKPE